MARSRSQYIFFFFHHRVTEKNKFETLYLRTSVVNIFIDKQSYVFCNEADNAAATSTKPTVNWNIAGKPQVSAM